MRLREFVPSRNPGDVAPNIGRLSNLGAISFGKSLTDKDEGEKTPHKEFEKVIEMFNENSLVNSGVNQLMLFLIPNKTVRVFSKDKKSMAFLVDWHKKRKNSLEEMKNLLNTNILFGNAPMEKNYTKLVKKGIEVPVLDNFFSNNDMTRLFINPDDPEGDTAFIFELPIGIKSFFYMGKLQNPQHYTVTYIKNYQYTFRRVWGIPIPAWKMVIYKSGWSTDNIYGRSMLASAIDPNNIIREILSSWDTIARTRQIDMKILTPDNSEIAFNWDEDKKKALEEELNDSSSSFKIFNFPMKFIQQDVNVSGNYDLLEGVWDLCRRMIMMSLLPQHLTPWSDTATTQGAETAMPAFLGRVKAKQNEFIAFMNENIIDELRKTYTWLAPDCTYILDEPKIMGDDYYIRIVTDLMNSDLLDKKQATAYLNRIGVIDADILALGLSNEGSTADSGGVDSFNSSSEGVKKKFNEQTINKSPIFSSWKRIINKHDSDVNTSTWKQLKLIDIGGRGIRLIKDNITNTIMIFDGINLITSMDSSTKPSVVASTYDDIIKRIKKQQEEFEDGETEEDKIIDSFTKQVNDEIASIVDDVLKDLSKKKNQSKTEAFIKDGVLSKIGSLFSGLTSRLNKSVGSILNKLNVNIIDDDEDSIDVTPETKAVLRKKKALLTHVMNNQINRAKGNVEADIKNRIAAGMAVGKTAEEIKADIRDSFKAKDGVSDKFTRTIRRELRNSSAILKLNKLLEEGFESFMWITRNDSVVRESHKKKNRRVFDIKKALTSNDIDSYPGRNYGCRCLIRPWI